MDNQKVIYDKRIPRILEEPKKTKSNKRFLWLIIFFFVVILLVLYLQSPISKLSKIEISGNVLLSDEEILSRADLKLGMSFFSLRSSTIEEKLPVLTEVENVEVHRIFPNKLSIKVKEHPYVSFWMKDQELYPVLSTGQILLNRTWDQGRVNRPILSHWPSKEGIIELSNELNLLDHSITSLISEIVMTPIVSDPYRLTLYMVDGYEVRTSIRNFAKNMSWYPPFVEQVKTDGHLEGIFHLYDAKWFEPPNQKEVILSESEEKGEQ